MPKDSKIPFDFSDQESWPKSHKICGDKSQSPINIVTMKAKKDKSMTIKFANYKKPLKKAFVENNGHTGNTAYYIRVWSPLKLSFS